MAKLKARRLNTEEVKYLLGLKKDDITLDLLRKMFADGKTWSKKFETYDVFTLPANKLFNTSAVQTTAGKYIFNLVVFPPVYLKKYGYVNKPLDGKVIGGIENDMGVMLLNDEMKQKEFVEYLDRGHWLTYGLSTAINPSTNMNFHNPIKAVEKRKDELFDEHKDAIEAGDVVVSQKIEEELKAQMIKHFEDTGEETLDIVKALGGKKYGNAQKISIMGGAVRDLASGKQNIIKSNYMNGVSKEDLPKMWDLTIFGGYSRGVDTADTGYEVKKLMNSMQSLVLDELGSDCGSKEYLEIEITKENAELLDRRYIVNKEGKTKAVDKDMLKQYIGKKLRFRSPMTCKSDKICNICAGDMHLKMGIKNVGLITTAIGGSLTNVMMKAFHDASIKTDTIDPEKYIQTIGKSK